MGKLQHFKAVVLFSIGDTLSAALPWTITDALSHKLSYMQLHTRANIAWCVSECIQPHTRANTGWYVSECILVSVDIAH